jgi:hypothetical protein
MAPDKLIKKVGVMNVPMIRLEIKTLINETYTADLKLNLRYVNKIIILAIPGLIPKIGVGKKNSAEWRMIAIAQNFEI